MKSIRNMLLKYILTYIAAVLLAVLLLLTVTIVPQKAVLNNCIQSAAQLEQEGLYPAIFANREMNMLDNQTEATMLMICCSNYKPTFNDILLNKNDGSDGNAIEGLSNMVLSWGTEEYYNSLNNYSRYWGGIKSF